MVIENSEKDKELVKDIKIDINDQQLFLKLNTLFSLLHFLSASNPNYELLPDKPNKCNLFNLFIR